MRRALTSITMMPALLLNKTAPTAFSTDMPLCSGGAARPVTEPFMLAAPMRLKAMARTE